MKTKRYWLCGGIIAAVISLILGWSCIYGNACSDVIVAIYIPALFAAFSKGGLFSPHAPSELKILVWIIINGFVYGAILGWIYGRIKNRKNKWGR